MLAILAVFSSSSLRLDPIETLVSRRALPSRRADSFRSTAADSTRGSPKSSRGPTLSVQRYKKLRYSLLHPIQYALDRGRSALRAGGTLRLLIASDNLAVTSEYQFSPLLKKRKRLRTQFGIVIDHRLIDEVLRTERPGGSHYDVVLAKVSFLVPRQEAKAKIAKLRALFPHPARLLYFDGDDDACVQWPALLDHVDLYVKKHMFADLACYQKEFAGKNNLTDYVARRHGTSFAESAVPHSGVVPEEQMGKVALGWNIGADPKMTELFAATKPAAPSEKTVDVMCRAACKPDAWIYPFRGPIAAALEPLRSMGYSVNVPDARVDQQEYYREMRESRICVSPFGYGEICWRDFEAVLMGSLLVKPDVGHLRSEPNIYVPGWTYVPVRWDFSDLAEVCARYLSDGAARQAITENAYRVLSGYFNRDAYADRFGELLRLAGVAIEHQIPHPRNSL